MTKYTLCLLCLTLGFFTWGCEPEKLERGKEMAVEAERHKVKRIMPEDMEKQAQAAGDTITKLVEGAFLQLAESQPKEQALFVAQPDKLPTVNAILKRYNATLERVTFGSSAEASKFFPAKTASLRNEAPAARVKLTPQATFQYQRPIVIRRRNCASCDEPSLLDFTAQELDKLRVFSAQGQPDGYEEEQLRGAWLVSFPKDKIIEQITLKTKPSRRGKLFASAADSTAKPTKD
jgi:hypothetical protein